MTTQPGLTSKLCITALVLAAVCVANFPYMFIDMLWHDDGQWFFRASENTILDLDWRGKVTALSPYLDVIYAHGMVLAGVPATRGLFIAVMALGSLGLFHVYRRIGFSTPVALAAAVIPNVLPSLRGIPVGLNASYALWGIAPLAGSLLCLNRYFQFSEVTDSGSHPKEFHLSGLDKAWTQNRWLYFCAALVLFYLALNLPGQPSTNFLIPNFLLFFALYLPVQPRRTLASALPFALMGAWMLYKQVQFTHIEPTAVSLEVVLDRARQFIEMSSFISFNSPHTLTIAYTLLTLGILVMLVNPRLVTQAPMAFANHGLAYRGLVIAWTVGWIVANGAAYLSASSQFRPYDYAYVFNFGMVLLQVVGLLGAIALILKTARSPVLSRVTLMTVAVAVLAYAATTRWQYALHPWGWKAYYQRTTIELRNNLIHRQIPHRGQVLVLGDKLGIFYNKGLHLANSGFMRYMLARNDVTSLIGSDIFPADVFAPWEGWFTHMRGFDPKLPIAAFRRVPGGKLNRVDLLLRTQPSTGTDLPRLRWELYDISQKTMDRKNQPIVLASGDGLLSYEEYVSTELPEEFATSDVAFAPPENTDRFANPKEVERIEATHSDWLPSPLQIGEHLALKNILPAPSKAANNKISFEILLELTSLADSGFRLSYNLGKEVVPVALWTYARVGDHLLLTTPPVLRSDLQEGIPLSFVNGGTHPHLQQTATNLTGTVLEIELQAAASNE